MATVTIREILVLALGCLVAWISSVIFANGIVPRNPINALLPPIVFCLIRAAVIGMPDTRWTTTQRVTWQLAIALGLTLLLVFEIGFGLFVGARDIPAVAWGVLTILGIAYVVLLVLAHLIATSSI